MIKKQAGKTTREQVLTASAVLAEATRVYRAHEIRQKEAWDAAINPFLAWRNYMLEDVRLLRVKVWEDMQQAKRNYEALGSVEERELCRPR